MEHILEEVVRCEHSEVVVHTKNPINNSYMWWFRVGNPNLRPNWRGNLKTIILMHTKYESVYEYGLGRAIQTKDHIEGEIC